LALVLQKFWQEKLWMTIPRRPTIPAPTWRREEIESINRISRLIVEEEDPTRFKVLLRELDELFQKEQERRARQIHATAA
jgi:hypothetical protein